MELVVSRWPPPHELGHGQDVVVRILGEPGSAHWLGAFAERLGKRLVPQRPECRIRKNAATLWIHDLGCAQLVTVVGAARERRDQQRRDERSRSKHDHLLGVGEGYANTARDDYLAPYSFAASAEAFASS